MLHGSGVVNLNHGRERMDGNKRGGLRVIGEDSRGLNGVDRWESGRIRGDMVDMSGIGVDISGIW